jgi:hypothetical protein
MAGSPRKTHELTTMLGCDPCASCGLVADSLILRSYYRRSTKINVFFNSSLWELLKLSMANPDGPLQT